MNIVERFLGYTEINTTTNQANGAAGIMPSSTGQYELACLVKKQLEELGCVDIVLRDTAILTATLPSNSEKKLPTVAFFGHLDTSSERTEDTHAEVVHYQGGDIPLSTGPILSLAEQPELANYIGQEIIVSDGQSLLGADDKAAIAAILNALQFFKENQDVEHGTVKVGFVPDEEQGLLGANAFDVNEFGADFAYTLDCCGIGEFVCENWNAGNAVVTFTGQSAHPMNSKGNLINSLLLANSFMTQFPAKETPEHTEGREGYYWMKKLAGNSAKTVLNMDIRDFTEEGYAYRKAFIAEQVRIFNERNNNRAVLELTDRYSNVHNYLKDSMLPVDLAMTAYKENGIEPKVIPMRGGYDGAVLSEKGLPCPNIFTGAHNFHSIFEYLPVPSLVAASNVVKSIIINLTEHEGL
ncbi:peptidase T [Vibrio artabrorum]|uniref:peptidase T n=1 Tax=Vibrio artabrorum TaxID=446374 RepID=UPI0021C30DDB|nr:peptidase T [Vibrio artabrorum]